MTTINNHPRIPEKNTIFSDASAGKSALSTRYILRVVNMYILLFTLTGCVYLIYVKMPRNRKSSVILRVLHTMRQ